MALIATSVSCQAVSAPPPRLYRDDPGVVGTDTVAMRSACALAENRCSRCHTLDRVVLVEMPSPLAWQDQVTRMRRLSGSAISRADGDAIVRCLVYRSFGSAGLASLAGAGSTSDDDDQGDLPR
jgi:hypothetical protein